MDNHFEAPLVRCSLWLHIGFIGASALAVALIQLLDGGANWFSALALACSGAVLAVVGWRRGRLVIESAESAIAKDPPRQSVMGDRAEPKPWIVNG